MTLAVWTFDLPILSATVLASVLVGIGAFFIAAAAIAYRKSNATASWHRTEGVIVAADVTRGRTADTAPWIPTIKYTYQIDGCRREGARLRVIERSYNFKSSAKLVVDQYRVGESVLVLVNPDDLEESVLIGGPQPWLASLIALVGVAFVLVGLYVVVAKAT